MGYCIVLLYLNTMVLGFYFCKNFEFSLKFWKPDIVIVSSLTKAQKVKKMLPDSFLVYLEGEGIAVNYSDMADHAVKHHSNLKLFNLILLWGDAQINSFKKYKNEIGIVNVHAIGNPKMDLVRYLPLNKIKIRKKSIGFLHALIL